MKGTKTSLFLIELMISLLLFAFCAAICVQLFNASNRRTESATDLSNAVFHATTVAEIYKSVGGDMNELAKAIDVSAADSRLADKIDFSEMIVVDFDSFGNQISWSDIPASQSSEPYAKYTVFIAPNGSGTADISVYKGRGYGLTLTEFPPADAIFQITVKAVVS